MGIRYFFLCNGSVKYPVKSYQTLTMTVQSAMTAQLKPRLQIYLS